MRIKLNSSDISLNILGSSLLIVIVGVVILLVSYNFVEKDYIVNNELNKEKFNLTKQKLRFLELKSDVVELVLDVNLSSTYVLKYLKQHEPTGKVIKFKKLNDLRNNKIIPTIAKMNKGLKDYPDEVKAEYNRIFDIVFRINSLEDELLKNYRDSVFITNKLIGKIGKLTQFTGELNTSSTEFLVDHLGITPSEFTSPKYKEDYLELIAASSLAFLLGVLLIVYRSSRYLKYPITHLESVLKNIYEGHLPSAIVLKNKDYLQIAKYTSGINEMLKKIQVFAQHVGKGQYDSHPKLKFIEKGKLGDALHTMQASLLNIAKEDLQRSHVNEGLARFSEILGNNSNNLERFGDEVILNLVQFLNANQGALFVIKDGEDDSTLQLTSCYAYEKKKYLNRQVVKGQGLVGQCWQEEKRIYMTDVPFDYINITSGLGYSTPRCVLIIPLIFNDVTQGIIELASFKELENYELNFVEKVGQSIASALASVKVNSKTQVLLNQSEQLTKKMKIQEEEMRSNVEELRLTQEESQRREEEHLREISRLRKRLEEYERSF